MKPTIFFTLAIIFSCCHERYKTINEVMIQIWAEHSVTMAPYHKYTVYPFAVKGKFSGLWAVRTSPLNGPPIFNGRWRDTIQRFFGVREDGWAGQMDTSEAAELGNEFQFKDSARAIKLLYDHRDRQEAKRLRYFNWQRKRDSLFNYFHTY